MKLVNGMIEREQNLPERDIGDSAFDTGSYYLGRMFNGRYEDVNNLKQFVIGVVSLRHPDLIHKYAEDPKEWGMSTDNEMPLYMAFRQAGMPEADLLKQVVKKRGWRTSNGKLVSFGYFAELVDSKLLRSLAVLGQLAINKIPWRYSDAKDIEAPWYSPKRIVSSKDHTDGYIQLTLQAHLSYKWVRNLINREETFRKIAAYYDAKEPAGTTAWVKTVYYNILFNRWT